MSPLAKLLLTVSVVIGLVACSEDEARYDPPDGRVNHVARDGAASAVPSRVPSGSLVTVKDLRLRTLDDAADLLSRGSWTPEIVRSYSFSNVELSRVPVEVKGRTWVVVNACFSAQNRRKVTLTAVAPSELANALRADIENDFPPVDYLSGECVDPAEIDLATPPS
ncbi:hypothetical protein [Gordonia sp. (in: high G+C Gram-positive bacteria)]|uniref:hypothetical protein n=1 Tax=Gordonia sp. (in: high G+C Gram-positive bacteria) TaxID=84139 RepID=UPI0035271AB7